MFLQDMPTEKVKKIVVTGTIGSGKSFVCNLLKEQGFPVLDLDQVAKEVRNKSFVKDEIRTSFGDEVFLEDGSINNEALSDIIFKDSEKRKTLESIIHQRVYDEMLVFFETNFYQKALVVEMAMLFEFKWENYFDSIWLVTSDEDVALERLMKYRGIDEAKAKSILATQISNIDKENRSNYVIMNNGTKEDVLQQVEDILKEEL